MNLLEYLSETEARGRVLVRRRHAGGDYEIRWKIVGFTRMYRKQRKARLARDRTGLPGNEFVILERLDDHSKSEPKGTWKIVHKNTLTDRSFVRGGWDVLESA